MLVVSVRHWASLAFVVGLSAPTLVYAQGTAVSVANSIAGTVTALENGRPVAAAVVSVVGSTASATTDVSGRFRLQPIGAGMQRLITRAIGLLPETTTVNVAGNTTLVSIALRRSPTALSAVAVTAQKRTESLQEVPVPVTAYDASFLTTQNIQQFDQLSAYVPGLNVQMQSPNNPGFVIRGITSDDGTSFVEPMVASWISKRATPPSW